MEQETLNISALAERFGLDRATVTKRLGDAPFTRGLKNAKEYNVADVAELLEAAEDSPELEAAKLRRAIADAEKAELMVAKLKGELVDRVAVLTEVQEIFSGLFQKICVQYVKRNAGRLSKCKTSAELAEMLGRDLKTIFEDLADEYSFETSDTSGDTA